MTIFSVALLLGCALLTALLLTPVVVMAAHRLALVDSPDGHRKLQAKSVPLGGGLAVGASVCFALALSVGSGIVPLGPDWGPFLQGFLPAALVLLVVGLVDDFIGITGIYKLLGQFVAASFLAVGGERFESISLLGPEINLGDFSILFAIFFCLGAINAFNLIDGADALASSVGAVACLTIGILAFSMGGLAPAALSFATAGALIGFLFYNAPPAKIYLGDTGSMLIGLTVAYASIACSVKQSAAIAIAVPVALCALPIMDAGAAFLRRVLTGQSIFDADRGHFHHSLMLRGFTAGQTALIAAGLTAVTCGGALASHFFGHEYLAFAAVLLVFAALAAFRVFGHAELHLVLRQSAVRGRTIMQRLRKKNSEQVTEAGIHLQGHRQWEPIWQALCEASPRFGVCSLKMKVNVPGIHESFYASWTDEHKDCTNQTKAWKLSVPLTRLDVKVGQLDAKGIQGWQGGYDSLQSFLDFLEPLDDQIADLIAPVGEVAAGELLEA